MEQEQKERDTEHAEYIIRRCADDNRTQGDAFVYREMLCELAYILFPALAGDVAWHRMMALLNEARLDVPADVRRRCP